MFSENLVVIGRDVLTGAGYQVVIPVVIPTHNTLKHGHQVVNIFGVIIAAEAGTGHTGQAAAGVYYMRLHAAPIENGSNVYTSVRKMILLK